jgi:hypothetical protein
VPSRPQPDSDALQRRRIRTRGQRPVLEAAN